MVQRVTRSSRKLLAPDAVDERIDRYDPSPPEGEHCEQRLALDAAHVRLALAHEHLERAENTDLEWFLHVLVAFRGRVSHNPLGATRPVRQSEVGRRQGNARRPRRAGARTRHRRHRPAPDDDLATLVAELSPGEPTRSAIAGGDGSLAVVAAAAPRTDSLSSAFPRARATISRSTSASIATTWSVRSTRSRTA